MLVKGSRSRTFCVQGSSRGTEARRRRRPTAQVRSLERKQVSVFTPALCLWAWTQGCGQGPRGTPPVHCAGAGRCQKRGVCPPPDPRRRPATCPAARSRCRSASPRARRLHASVCAAGRASALRPPAPRPRTCPRTCPRAAPPAPTPDPTVTPTSGPSVVYAGPSPGRPRPSRPDLQSPSLPLPGRGGAFPRRRGRGAKEGG